MRCFIVLALLSLMPASASAAPEHATCGANVSDNLQQARRALATEQGTGSRHALVCLIEAVEKLDAANTTATRRDGNTIVNIPNYTGKVKSDR